MATGTVRLGIIVALVVGGVAVISRFPNASSGAAGAETSPPAATHSPKPSSTASGTNGGTNGGTQSSPAPVKGVRVAVYNGTYQTGLAADVATVLVNKFKVKVPSNAVLDASPKPVDTTTLYFVSSDDKPAAETLADFFKKKLPSPPKVQRLPDNFTVPNGVQIAAYIGLDYVNG